MKWRPIETAPRDGEDVLVWTGGGIERAFWTSGGWHDTLAYGVLSPSHWMPLPSPPKPPKPKRAPRDSIADRLLAALRLGPATAYDLAPRLSQGPATVCKALVALEELGLAVRDRKGVKPTNGRPRHLWRIA